MHVNEVVTSPCNNCGHPTNHLVAAVRHFEEWVGEEEGDGDLTLDLEHEYAMLECGGCQGISLRADEMLDGTPGQGQVPAPERGSMSSCIMA